MSFYIKKVLLCLFCTAIGFFIGLIVGAFIGGNFGFPILFGGLVGYESAGLLFAILGALLGLAAPLWLYRNKSK
ncbi:MAG: hypothetical protein JJT94_04875 [Bernardetiaceae bacterium]|nr:hypothetical protein [Bernardetiaceae bacterium]